MALLNSMSQTQMIHVPYKGGGPAVVALASGETQAMTATIPMSVPIVVEMGVGENWLQAH